MSSYEFARFMETADGKSRKENIARIPGGEPGEPIIYMEVDSQTAKEWKRENNRACYLQKTMNALGIEVISYNVSPNAEDWEVTGDALLENPDCHVEDDVLRSILTENMLDAMCHLSEIEQKVREKFSKEIKSDEEESVFADETESTETPTDSIIEEKEN